AAVWTAVGSGESLYGRLVDLPGYGAEKSRIFVALLAKRMGVAPAGWEDSAGPFADDKPRSVADIDGPEALAQVRAWKKA
ncbi:MAG TPA: Fe-S cluster assembly protein HesB, partial [Acidimicrobiaceae bacterium]|nr:Fe-S cluster assembly protein HesB [Acidimicrobiaceae bacterium]